MKGIEVLLQIQSLAESELVLYMHSSMMELSPVKYRAEAKTFTVRQGITVVWQLFGRPVNCCQASQHRST